MRAKKQRTTKLLLAKSRNDKCWNKMQTTARNASWLSTVCDVHRYKGKQIFFNALATKSNDALVRIKRSHTIDMNAKYRIDDCVCAKELKKERSKKQTITTKSAFCPSLSRSRSRPFNSKLRICLIFLLLLLSRSVIVAGFSIIKLLLVCNCNKNRTSTDNGCAHIQILYEAQRYCRSWAEHLGIQNVCMWLNEGDKCWWCVQCTSNCE